MDVSCAFLYAKCERSLYIELPELDREPGKDLVGKLNKALYGTKDAPQRWLEELKEHPIP